MPYSVNEADLKALIQTAVGPHVDLSWKWEPENFQGFASMDPYGVPVSPTPTTQEGGPCKVTMDITTSTGVGTDDMRTAMVDGTWLVDDVEVATEVTEVTQVGARHFTLSLKVESDASTSPLGVAERVRAIWQRKSFLESLRGLGCALRTVSDVRTGEVSWDQRTIRYAVVEVFLTFGVEEIDTMHDGLWIEVVGNHETEIVDVPYAGEVD